MLIQFEQMLSAYFGRQDAELTPRLTTSGIAGPAMTAREFAAELEDLRKMCPPYFRGWSSAAAIDGQLDSFRYESDLVLGAIENRLKRENLQLYPAADEVARMQAA